jgi:hypothetical protein
VQDAVGSFAAKGGSSGNIWDALAKKNSMEKVLFASAILINFLVRADPACAQALSSQAVELLAIALSCPIEPTVERSMSNSVYRYTERWKSLGDDKTLKILQIRERNSKYATRVLNLRSDFTYEAKFRDLVPISYRVPPFNRTAPLDPEPYPVIFLCVDNLDCVSSTLTDSSMPEIKLRHRHVQMHHCDEERRLDVEAAVKALIDLNSRGSP